MTKNLLWERMFIVHRVWMWYSFLFFLKLRNSYATRARLSDRTSETCAICCECKCEVSIKYGLEMVHKFCKSIFFFLKNRTIEIALEYYLCKSNKYSLQISNPASCSPALYRREKRCTCNCFLFASDDNNFLGVPILTVTLPKSHYL